VDVRVREREFYLDQDAGTIAIEHARPAVERSRWSSVLRGATMHMALVLAPGERAMSVSVRVGADTVLECDAGPFDARPHGTLVADVVFEPDDSAECEPLATLPIGAGERRVRLRLDAFAGRAGRFGIAVSGDADARAAVTRFIVARDDRVGLLAARSHQVWRARNEIAHFSTAYESDFYASRQSGSGDDTARAFDDTDGGDAPDDAEPAPTELTVDEVAATPAAAVRPGENAFAYGTRVLGKLVAASAPDFARRLAALHRDGRPVDVLSICSGEATVERDILRAAGVPVRMTLFDISETLLERAARNIGALARVRTIAGNVNLLTPDALAGRYDAVVCVSGLHHIVELERVLDVVGRVLRPNGELWVVGEAIGRDGNRLWPDALETVDGIFAMLPERYRRNATTGRVDERFPNDDLSTASFEGIRSEEIESLLLARFEPLAVYRRNCFLWRLLDGAYYTNYDLRLERDRRLVLWLVTAEYNHWKRGGRPTELHAVYGVR
jgi:SAM-dependent methyltransferase